MFCKEFALDSDMQNKVHWKLHEWTSIIQYAYNCAYFCVHLRSMHKITWRLNVSVHKLYLNIEPYPYEICIYIVMHRMFWIHSQTCVSRNVQILSLTTCERSGSRPLWLKWFVKVKSFKCFSKFSNRPVFTDLFNVSMIYFLQNVLQPAFVAG